MSGEWQGCRACWPAAFWAMSYALVHVYWASGGRSWLPADIAITSGSALFTVSLAAIPLLIGAGVAVLMGCRDTFPLSSRHAAVIAGCVWLFCLVHAIPALAMIAWQAMQSGRASFSIRDWYGLSYEVNWLLGGAMFIRAHLGLRRQDTVAHRDTAD